MPPVSRTLLAAFVVCLCACSAPAPRATTSPAAASKPAPTATPRPETAPIGLVVTQVDEQPVPPADPTPIGLGAGRPTATPYATADAAWKYVTFFIAAENRSDSPRLLGIGGSDPQHTNLGDSTLIGDDGMRYKAFQSYSSFGLRTATARSLNNYPVLLRLPPGLRAEMESFGSVTTLAPQRTSITFRVPTTVTRYRTLTVPPLPPIGTRNADDDTGKRERGLIGTLQPLDLAGVAVGPQQPSPAVAPALTSGRSASVPGLMTVTVMNASEADPPDFQARNRGWKLLTVGLRFRNDDPAAAHAFSVSAWLFGDDGVVYSGDVPAIGDFGRALAAPEPNIMAAWDGRSAGPDAVAPGQEQDSQHAVFQVPKTLTGGYLALAGEIEALWRLDNFAS